MKILKFKAHEVIQSPTSEFMYCLVLTVDKEYELLTVEFGKYFDDVSKLVESFYSGSTVRTYEYIPKYLHKKLEIVADFLNRDELKEKYPEFFI